MTVSFSELADLANGAWIVGVYALPFLAGISGWQGRKILLVLASIFVCCAFVVAQSAIVILGEGYSHWTGMEGLGLVVGPLIITAAILFASLVHVAIGWLQKALN